MYDIIIAGSGFCGSTISRLAADEGKKVLLLEKRDHIAGNMFDEKDAAGVLVHRYGPHILHTSIEGVYRFLTSIGEWEDFSLKCRAVLDGISTPTPFNFETVDMFFDETSSKAIKDNLLRDYPGQTTVSVLDLLKSKDDVIKNYAEFLLEKDYRPYTAKQWGILPEQIDPSVLKRVPVCLSYSDEYFSDIYQMLPVDGYTEFFKKLLGHPLIEVVTDCDALDRISIDLDQKMILFDGKKIDVPFVYTGAIDTLFGNTYDSLPYRSLRFDYQTHDKKSYQDAPVVAYPQETGYTRITEYTKLPIQDVGEKTTVAVEYPLAVDKNSDIEPYYPIPTDETLEQYNRYKALADGFRNLFLCGRLADYKYYNMDSAIQRAFDVYETISLYMQHGSD